MDLSYTEEQALLRSSAERFLAEEYGFARGQKAAARPDGYDSDIWSRFGALGWLALPFPESVGGLGGGALDLALLMEAFGKALIVEPYLATVALGGGAIVALGDATQQAAT